MQLLLARLFAIISIAAMGAEPFVKVLHTFQQNRYELRRYSGWLGERHKFQPGFWLGMVGVLVGATIWIILPFSDLTKLLLSGIFNVVVLVFFYLFVPKKTAIKPLRWTHRVLRQALVFVLLWLGIYLYAIAALPLGLYSYLYVIVLVLPWFLLYVVALLLMPVEKLVWNHYLSLAKKKLSTMPELIKVGITGSYGKTSCKNIAQQLLSQHFYTLMTPASYNTPMGITITIRSQLEKLHQVFLCEMGADKVGEISYLARFVEPKYGIVTAVGPQHLNTFGSIENIVKEKMALIELLPADGVGIINKDNQYVREYPLQCLCELRSIGILSGDVDYRATDITYDAAGSRFKVVTSGESYDFSTGLLGEHNITNILCAIALARELGISWEDLIIGVKNLSQVEHRLQIKQINGYTFIDNAFNSNPAGAAMSLEVLSRMPGKRIIITPGMIDLGAQEESANRNFGKQMKGKADEVILVGQNRTKAIAEGLAEIGFDEKHIHIVKSVRDGFALVYKNFTTSDTILLENDLPDAFSS